VRRTIVILAAGMLTIALYFANVAWWLETEILDSESFVETTLVAMEDEATRDAAAAIIVDRLSDEFPLLRLLDTALIALFSDLIGREVIEPLIIETSIDVHRRIIEGDQSELIIDLDPYRGLLLAPLESLSPQLAARVPDDWFRSVEVLEEGTLPDLATYARRTELAAIIATLLAMALVGVIVTTTRRWFAAFTAIGMALVLAGGFSALLVPGARSTAAIFLSDEPSTVLLTGVFNVFTQPLMSRSLAILAAGALLLVAALLGWLIDQDKHPTAA
jgi:hypothetical protein